MILTIEYGILVDGKVVICDYNSEEFKSWNRNDKLLIQNHVYESWLKWITFKRPRKLWVSTVFLTLNHGGYADLPDQWFETMIFHKDYSDLYCERYATLQEATEGHKRAIKAVRNGAIGRDSYYG